MSAGIVDDNCVGHTVLAEFPSSQGCSLIAWASLIDPDMHRDAAVVGLINGCSGGSPVDRCQPPGIAMCKDIDLPVPVRRRSNKLQAMVTDGGIDCDIFIGYLLSAD